MRYFKALMAVVMVAILAGCAKLPAHNNTLIFAVKREVGVGVHAPGASTDPGIYLGYSSREIAWVPLWANGKDGPMPCGIISTVTATASVTGTPAGSDTTAMSANYKDAECMKGPKFLADGEKKQDPHDAYSTFASFGGDLNGSIDAPPAQTKANAKLASFFATGIAAQNLSRMTGLVSPVFKGDKKDKDKDKEKDSTDSQTLISDFLVTIAQASPGGSATASIASCVSKMAADATVAIKEADQKKISESSDKEKIEKSVKVLKSTIDDDSNFEALGQAAALLKKRFDGEVKKKGTDSQAAQIMVVCKVAAS